MEMIFKTAEKIESNDNEMSVIGWGSKPTADRDKELILSNAWKLDNYKKNPVLLLAHKYDIPPCGKILWVKEVPGQGLRFKAKFANTERGKELYELYSSGMMSAFSVGFSPNKGGYIDNPTEKEYQGLKRVYKDIELLEISCVAVPANADALVEFVKSGKVKNKQLKEELDQVIEIEDNPVKTIDEVVKTDEVKDIDETVDIDLLKAIGEVTDEIIKEKQVGIVEVKLDAEVIDKFQEQFESLNQAVKLLSDKIELIEKKKDPTDKTEEVISHDVIIETKVLSPDGLPSVFDITNAINLSLRKSPSNGVYPSDPVGYYDRYVVDVFPDEYPSGSVVYQEYNQEIKKTEYYKIDYDYDISTGLVTFNSEPEKVEQSWVTNKYNVEEKDFDDIEEKEGRVLSGKNRKLISDCIEMLNGLMEMTPKGLEDEELEIDDIEEKDFDEEDEIELEEKSDEIEIDEEALTEALTKMTKSFVKDLNVNDTISNSFKKLRGKVS